MRQRAGGFIGRLKQHYLYGVAVAYAIVVGFLIPLVSGVFPYYGWAGAVPIVITVLLLGFPIAVAFAWLLIEPKQASSKRHAWSRRHWKLSALLTALVIALVVISGFYALQSPRAHAPVLVEQTVAGAQAPVERIARPAPAVAIPPKSIAVLPFENLSDDKQNEYFVSGMQDLILTKLAGIAELKVIARTSTAGYTSHPGDLKTVGRELGVATLLEGSVQKAGSEVLINVQLIDAEGGNHLWAQSYQRTLDNIFGVEGEVAQKIAAALQARLTSMDTAKLVAVPTQNRAAYDLFLRAEYQSNRANVNYDSAGWKLAIPLYQQALAEDPGFALAWARLSWVESHLAWFGGGGGDVRLLNRQARAAAERALQLQPGLAASQRAIGYNDYWGRGDFAAALRAFDAVLEHNPNDVDALAGQGWVLRREGHVEAGLASLQQALALDPRNSFLTSELGMTYMVGSRYADAERTFQRALAIEPDNHNAMVNYSNTVVFDSSDLVRALALVAGDAPALKLQRVTLLMYQRKYPAALALLDSIPDSPDTFAPVTNTPKTLQQVGSKAQQQAYLHERMGDPITARRLYAGALPAARQLQEGINLAAAWQAIAAGELGLGQVAEGVDAVGKAQAIDDKYAQDRTFSIRDTVINASLYARAGRAGRAVLFLARALAASNVGYSYSPVLLWLDPAWDPIRSDPRFQALLTQYAKYKPAVIPAAKTSVAASPAYTSAAMPSTGSRCDGCAMRIPG